MALPDESHREAGPDLAWHPLTTPPPSPPAQNEEYYEREEEFDVLPHSTTAAGVTGGHASRVSSLPAPDAAPLDIDTPIKAMYYSDSDDSDAGLHYLPVRVPLSAPPPRWRSTGAGLEVNDAVEASRGRGGALCGESLMDHDSSGGEDNCAARPAVGGRKPKTAQSKAGGVKR